MEQGSDLTILADAARDTLEQNDPDALLKLARLIGFDGLTMSEASEQLGFDPDVVRNALAMIPRFAALIDAYRGAKIRDMHGLSVKQISDALENPEDLGLAESSARMHRAVQALYKEVRTGERERDKLASKAVKKTTQPVRPARVSEVVVSDVQRGLKIEGDEIDAEFEEDTDELSDAG